METTKESGPKEVMKVKAKKETKIKFVFYLLQSHDQTTNPTIQRYIALKNIIAGTIMLHAVIITQKQSNVDCPVISSIKITNT